MAGLDRQQQVTRGDEPEGDDAPGWRSAEEVGEEAHRIALLCWRAALQVRTARRGRLLPEEAARFARQLEEVLKLEEGAVQIRTARE